MVGVVMVKERKFIEVWRMKPIVSTSKSVINLMPYPRVRVTYRRTVLHVNFNLKVTSDAVKYHNPLPQKFINYSSHTINPYIKNCFCTSAAANFFTGNVKMSASLAPECNQVKE